MSVRSRFTLTDRDRHAGDYRANKGAHFLLRIFLSPPFKYNSAFSPFVVNSIIISSIYIKIARITAGDDIMERKKIHIWDEPTKIFHPICFC